MAPNSIADVIRAGLCIGCGLCEAVTGARVRMIMTARGSLRPVPADGFEAHEETQLLSACPGVGVEPRAFACPEQDLVWGSFADMRYAWAGNPEIRFRAATGGVLTALGVQLLRSGRARFILQVRSDPDQPMRSRWDLNTTPAEVIAAAGSRYGPTAPLAGLAAALARGEPFAIIAKPCDLSAVHRMSVIDPRIDRFCIARLAMVCGGQSQLGKSTDLLDEFGLVEEEVSLCRYRGYGNPGRTRIETTDGRAFEKSYLELWEDEQGWQLEARCKLCPDALGEAADVAAADVWPGGSPVGEDAGFNGIIVRSPAGTALVEAAVAAGDLVLGDPIAPRQFDDFQPHQKHKKQALAARYEALSNAGALVLDAPGLRLGALAGLTGDDAAFAQELEATRQRIAKGLFSEPLPNQDQA